MAPVIKGSRGVAWPHDPVRYPKSTHPPAQEPSMEGQCLHSVANLPSLDASKSYSGQCPSFLACHERATHMTQRTRPLIRSALQRADSLRESLPNRFLSFALSAIVTLTLAASLPPVIPTRSSSPRPRTPRSQVHRPGVSLRHGRLAHSGSWRRFTSRRRLGSRCRLTRHRFW